MSALYQTVFCLLIASCLSASRKATIAGPLGGMPLFNDLITAFELGHPDTIDFIPLYNASLSDINAHLNQGEAVVVTTMDNVPPDTLVIPMFGYPIVVVYNLPDTSSTLLLSQSAVVDIYLGRITHWNHSNLTVLNPNINFPDLPIQVMVGSLQGRTSEGLSVLAGYKITNSDVSRNATNAQALVCARVQATPYTLGFSWLGDALLTNATVAFIQNREGYFADPATGVAIAIGEYSASIKAAGPNVVVLPHNMPGRLSWPLLAFLWIVLPKQLASCDALIVLQNFLSMVMFETDSMDTLCQVLGWEPAKSLTTLTSSLGKVTTNFDYRDALFGIECGTKAAIRYYTVGTSRHLSSFVLKLVAPFTGVTNTEFRLLASDQGATTFLDSMVGAISGDVDITFTHEPVAKLYPELLFLPIFMGAVAPVINLPGIPSVVLSIPVLVEIFSGGITRWDDNAVKALNPTVTMPPNPINVFAAPVGQIDGATALFAQSLSTSALSTRRNPFAWTQVNVSVPEDGDIGYLVQYTPYSIGYSWGTSAVATATSSIPQLIGSTGKPISFAVSSVFSCWKGMDNPECWPVSIRLGAVVKHAKEDPAGCAHQKQIMDFVAWIYSQVRGLDKFVLSDRPRMGEAEFCLGRSLIVTIPEPQVLNPRIKAACQALAGIGLFWALCQAIALAIARKQSELKSASVLFSLLAVVGVFSILLAPLLIVQDDVSVSNCGASVWFLCFGFTLCYGSLFAKLFRLYAIFTSRKLVVPRLSNKRLLGIVSVFLAIDFILVLIYAVVTPPEPFVFSSVVPSPIDLATGYREYTLQMCAFHVDSPVLYLILIFKSLIAFGGAAMAFFIRQVDRRFSATSALGWAFYNMFLTVIIVIIISVQFGENSSLESALFIPVFGGLWIMIVTLCALTLDSNVLLACQDVSKPLRRMLNGKNSRDSKEPKKLSNEAEPGDSKRSNISTVFVVNREMFPTKYDSFENELLEKILEELNFQRAAVRRALIPSSSATTTTTVELADRPLGSMRIDSPGRFSSKSKSGFVPTTSGEKAASSSILGLETPPPTYGTLKVSVDRPSDSLPEPLDMKTNSDDARRSD